MDVSECDQTTINRTYEQYEHTMIKTGWTCSLNMPQPATNISLDSHWHCSIIAYGQQTSLSTRLTIKHF